MKREVDTLVATPEKRIFLSIIADYDLNRSICELVDNAIDVWVRGGRQSSIEIKIDLDKAQQTITVEDNAGGLPKGDLRFVVGPGHTGNATTDETIGMFGVGTKRAVVALSQDITISTRHARDKTYQIEIDDSWLGHEDWSLPVYEVDEIGRGSTIVLLQRLRISVTDEAKEQLREYLGATYAKFLSDSRVQIILDKVPVVSESFEGWAYPPKYAPTHYTGELDTEEGGKVRVEVLAGLSNESSPVAGEYGVYFYCNDRLIARGLKNYDVGFAKGLAGQPHPRVSLTKVIVSLHGDARFMPWNSSKSDINPKHEVFKALRDWLVRVVADYAAVSRAWEGSWPEHVFKYKTGKMKEVAINSFPAAKKSYLPPAPKSRPRYGEVVTVKKQTVVKAKPWTRGLYEGVVAADLILKTKMEQRNRIGLIVLDSTLEIAFKEYLVNESGTSYSEKRWLEISGDRAQVQNEVKKHVTINDGTWRKIEHYYRLRCKLIHERATAPISDSDIADFRAVVESVLGKLFNLKFKT